jgi:hypothetical protein
MKDRNSGIMSMLKSTSPQEKEAEAKAIAWANKKVKWRGKHCVKTDPGGVTCR